MVSQQHYLETYFRVMEERNKKFREFVLAKLQIDAKIVTDNATLTDNNIANGLLDTLGREDLFGKNDGIIPSLKKMKKSMSFLLNQINKYNAKTAKNRGVLYKKYFPIELAESFVNVIHERIEKMDDAINLFEKERDTVKKRNNELYNEYRLSDSKVLKEVSIDREQIQESINAFKYFIERTEKKKDQDIERYKSEAMPLATLSLIFLSAGICSLILFAPEGGWKQNLTVGGFASIMLALETRMFMAAFKPEWLLGKAAKFSG